MVRIRDKPLEFAANFLFWSGIIAWTTMDIHRTMQLSNVPATTEDKDRLRMTLTSAKLKAIEDGLRLTGTHGPDSQPQSPQD